MRFLRKALTMATTVYSLHKTSTRDVSINSMVTMAVFIFCCVINCRSDLQHIQKKAGDWAVKMEVIAGE